MFIGDIVKLTDEGKEALNYVKCPKNEWVFIITGIDEENLDYYIDSLCVEPESNMIHIVNGDGSIVLENYIDKVNLSKDELFHILKEQNNFF